MTQLNFLAEFNRLDRLSEIGDPLEIRSDRFYRKQGQTVMPRSGDAIGEYAFGRREFDFYAG